MTPCILDFKHPMGVPYVDYGLMGLRTKALGVELKRATGVVREVLTYWNIYEHGVLRPLY